MPVDRLAQFRAKADLVRLFKAQLELVRAADPDGIGPHLHAVDTGRYDALLAAGPSARWPTGTLPGLREGVRDLQHILELAYGPARQKELIAQLSEKAGDAVEVLRLRDARALAAVLKHGRIRNAHEYYLVRTAVDRLEAEEPRNETLLRQLWELVDAASVADAT